MKKYKVGDKVNFHGVVVTVVEIVNANDADYYLSNGFYAEEEELCPVDKQLVSDSFRGVGIVGDDTYGVIVFDRQAFNYVSSVYRGHQYGTTYYLLSFDDASMTVRRCWRGCKVIRLPRSVPFRFVNPYKVY